MSDLLQRKQEIDGSSYLLIVGADVVIGELSSSDRVVLFVMGLVTVAVFLSTGIVCTRDECAGEGPGETPLPACSPRASRPARSQASEARGGDRVGSVFVRAAVFIEGLLSRPSTKLAEELEAGGLSTLECLDLAAAPICLL